MALFRWKDNAGVELYVKFDAVKVVEFAQEAEVSKHPVEQGPDVADHIRPLLPTVNVTAYMSNTPLYTNDGVDQRAEWGQIELPVTPRRRRLSNPAGAVEDSFTDNSPIQIYGLIFNDLSSRVREVKEKLKEALENGYLLSIEDNDENLENLAINRNSSIRSLEDGDGATIQLQCEQIKLTTVETVSAPEPAEIRGRAPKKIGAQATKPDPNAEEKKTQMKSLLKTLYDGATGG